MAMEGNSRAAMDEKPSNSTSQNVSVSSDIPDSSILQMLTGKDFVPIVLLIKPGEDIIQKIRACIQDHGQTGFIMSVYGSVYSPTLDTEDSAIPLEESFIINELHAQFLRTKDGQLEQNGSTKLKISDSMGNVFGGLVIGSLFAAATIQVVLGCFTSGDEDEK